MQTDERSMIPGDYFLSMIGEKFLMDILEE
jgi:hypothetical protein